MKRQCDNPYPHPPHAKAQWEPRRVLHCHGIPALAAAPPPEPSVSGDPEALPWLNDNPADAAAFGSPAVCAVHDWANVYEDAAAPAAPSGPPAASAVEADR
jgi:hypothetical protein